MSHYEAKPKGLCYSYVRMSSARQIAGDSQRRQIEEAENYAERHGLRLAPPMRDLGVSAFKGRHRKDGALGLFLKAIEDGEIPPGTLVIEAVDRLSREEPLTIINLLGDILNRGFVIHILSTGWTLDKISVNKSAWQLNAIVSQAQLAHSESVQKSDRISAAYVTRRKQARAGKLLKGAYHPSWIRREYLETGEVRHHVIPEVAEAVRMVFELHSQGFGSHTTAKILNQRGVPPVPAFLSKDAADNAKRQVKRRWYQAYCGRLTLDRRVIGEYQPRTIVDGKSVAEGEPIPGYYPQIIPDELWQKVQDTKHPFHGVRTGTRKMQFSNLLTGMARCAHCGNVMSILGDNRSVATGGERRTYMRCSAHHRGGDCDAKGVSRYDWFESKLLNALPGLPWGKLLEREPGDDPTAEIRKALAAIDVQIDRKTATSARLLKVLEDEDDPDPEVITRRRQLREEIKTLQGKRAGYAAELNAAEIGANSDLKVVENLTNLTLAMNVEDQVERAAVRQKIHAVLRRVIRDALFLPGVKEAGEPSIPPRALIYLRGGMMLDIRIDLDSPVEANFEMGKFHDFLNARTERGIPPLEPNEDGTQLIKKNSSDDIR